MAERQAAKLRLEYQDAEQLRIQFQDEVNKKSHETDVLPSFSNITGGVAYELKLKYGMFLSTRT